MELTPTGMRSPSLEDLQRYVKWSNDPEICSLDPPVGTVSNVIVWSLYVRDVHIGMVTISNITRTSAEFGIRIGAKEYWGRGFGTIFTSAALDYCFNTLGLTCVQLKVLPTNTRAVRCYEKCGFRHEGRLRKARFSDGRYHDELMMGILRQEFEELNGNG